MPWWRWNRPALSQSLTVIARLDRAIQYTLKTVASTAGDEYWTTRFRG
jgi:hypothetical protein